MKSYLEMDKASLTKELDLLQNKYNEYKNMGLKLDMSRGKPCSEQLDLSLDMMKEDKYISENGMDVRNYGVLEGIPEARRFFGDMLGVNASEVIVGGNASLQLMYAMVEIGYRVGFPTSEKPWSKLDKVKFLCPAPGYDRHFRITEHFGIELITVPMTKNGPDMDMVESLVASDDSIKGIWCVPMYSNPDGYTYSDDTVKRFANLKTAASDFKIFWDNAYCVHHLTDTPDTLLNLMDECKKQGTEDRILMFCSTSKITFSGAGVAAMATSEEMVKYITENLFVMTISFDKVNQLRHVNFLKDMDGVKAHMKKHREILQPKFEAVLEILEKNLGKNGDIATWTQPNGGYFVSFFGMDGTAKRTVALCKEANVIFTGAGAAYPYSNDEKDSHVRIAPSFPSMDELKIAMEMFTICLKMATIEKLLQK